jgi:heme-degrading monooxygenase HmoA
MYSATFIFDKKQYDDEFYALDTAIAEAAKQTEGYLGEESWQNTETGRVCNVYYWCDLQSLQALINHPKHLEAKAQQANWLNGYQIVIAEVIRTYGDGSIAHPTENFKPENFKKK